MTAHAVSSLDRVGHDFIPLRVVLARTQKKLEVMNQSRSLEVPGSNPRGRSRGREKMRVIRGFHCISSLLCSRQMYRCKRRLIGTSVEVEVGGR